MALYDNKFWLLSHIRNSFISTDDTGNIRKCNTFIDFELILIYVRHVPVCHAWQRPDQVFGRQIGLLL